MDTSEHLDDRAHAIALIERFEPRLIDEAEAFLAREPDATLIGVVAERGGREWNYLRRLVTADTGQEIAQDVLLGVIPRETIPDVFQDPVTVARWVDEVAPPFMKTRLPIMAALKRGYQGKWVDLPESG